MASTYSTNLAIELIGTGDQAGSWGNTTNTNLGTLIEQAISGYVTQAVATGTDTTITIPNGATGVARNMYIELTGTGGTNTNLIVPANKKLYFIFNNSTGAVTVKVSGQTGVSVPQGKKVVLTSNGTDVVNGLNYIADFGSNSATITQLTATSATITNLTLTSLVISNLSIASANITTLTSASATITNLINTSASITTITNSPTFSAGTANGVLYLNGSKVATSGSALVFDGTNLGLGTSSNKTTVVTGGATGMTIAAVGAPALAVWDTTDASYVSYLSQINESTYFGNYANGPLYFQTNAITRATLDSSGNLGIGTTSPTRKLTISGSGVFAATTGSSIRLDNSSTGRFAIVDLDNSQNLNIWNSDSGAGSIVFWRGSGAGTETARFDASGNLGLGVTPSAWDAGFQVLENSGGSLFSGSNTAIRLIQNSYFGTGAYRYKFSSTPASWYNMVSGQHQWYNAPSGTAGNAITFTQAMTLDASGNLLVGTTSGSGARLDVSQSNTTTTTDLRISNAGSSGLGGAQISFGHNPNAQLGYIKNNYENYGGGTNWFMSFGTTNSFRFVGDILGTPTERLRIDGSGNVGLGVTPSAWGTANTERALQLNAGSVWSYSTFGFGLINNAFYDSTGNYKYIRSAYALDYFQSSSTGAHIWRIAASGTAGNTITFTQAMTLDASGNLLVGQQTGASTTTPIRINSGGTYGTTLSNGIKFVAYDDGGVRHGMGVISGQLYLNTADASTVLSFATNNTERARITSGGSLLYGCTAAPSSTVKGIGLQPNGTNFFYGSAVNSTSTIVHMEFYNPNGTVGSISTNGFATAYNIASDVRLKKNIVDSQDAGADVDALKVRAFDWKVDDAHVKYGFVAQELAAVAPEAVKVGDNNEEVTDAWGVDYSKLVPMLVKEIQSLRARVAQLESK